jgi:hypothetical protein
VSGVIVLPGSGAAFFWRVVLQAGHRFRGPTGKMMQSSTCLDLKVPHCVDMELTRFHSNLRARADKTFGPGGFDLAFQISLGAVLNSGCFSIRHSSGLWLPARLDSHGVSRRSVSRAGHAPGGPGQARARYSYCRTYCGLNRKRQSLGQWSEKLRREIRPRPRRDACAGQCSARAPWSASRTGIPFTSRETGPCLSQLCRFARHINRDRSARLGHGLFDAATL